MEQNKIKISLDDLISEFLKETEFEKLVSEKSKEMNKKKDTVFSSVVSDVMLERYNTLKQLSNISLQDRIFYLNLLNIVNGKEYLEELESKNSAASKAAWFMVIGALMFALSIVSSLYVLKIGNGLASLGSILSAFISIMIYVYGMEKQEDNYFEKIKDNIMIKCLKKKSVKYQEINKLSLLLLKEEMKEQSEEDFRENVKILLNETDLNTNHISSLNELARLLRK